jgi:uncharacterized membrane protein (UPF0127 family)
VALVRNLSKETLLAADAAVAKAPWTRMIGLMGQASLPGGKALIFPGTQGVHTHFMRFPIDLLFYDRAQRVYAVAHAVKPWRFSPYHLRAKGVIELPAGALVATRTEPGDQLAIEGL